MHEFDIVSIGEAMAEIRRLSPDGADGEFGVGFAGDTFNTAVYCKRSLGEAGNVAYLTRIGQDSLSVAFTQMAEREGLNVSHITRDAERAIGIYSVATDGDGERSFAYWRDRSAARLLFSTNESIELPKARLYYLSGITLAILSQRARTRLVDYLAGVIDSGDSLVAFDSNYRPSLWESESAARQTIADMWDVANVALPSIDDEMALFGDASEVAVAERFFSRQWAACAIKRGSRGPITPTFPDPSSDVFPAASSVVDTTAAGDSFNGGYLASYLSGDVELECLKVGHQLAAEVVGKPGAIMPRGEQTKTSKKNG